MLRNFNIVILLSILFFLPYSMLGQKTSRKKLEAKRVALKKEITNIKSYLDNTKKKERSLNNQVLDLNKKISTRQDLVNTITREIDLISNQINKNAKKINLLQDELDVLKKEYTSLIYKSYKNKSEDNRLLFLLSSKSFFQGFQRFQYMKQYSEYRRNQGDSIENKSRKLLVLNDSLSIMRKTKHRLIEEQQYEQGQIVSEKEKQEDLAKKYRAKKKKYQSEIRKKQREEKKLTQQIEDIIRQAIKKSGTTSKGFKLTPAAKALATQFISNKGKLPWPVEKGLVTLGYGTQPDPMDSKLKLQSSGVRIATNEKAKARVVFNGKVMAIQKNPQTGVLSVLVGHGNYISVYANLEKVTVSQDQTLKTKQNIGTIHTDRVTGKTILKFQIWKDLTKQNPEEWIYKM